jgi:DNA adenine methylase
MPSRFDGCPPFLKWAGGKRWFAARYLDLLPARFDRYIEPFLGSGALFFALRPPKAILADLNADLIATYLAIQGDWKRVVRILGRHNGKHSKEFYYSVRSSQPRTPHGKAARFIYLNRTCWNGLYRVNTRGQFNVPVGTKEKVLLGADDFCRASVLLKGATLMTSDFERVVCQARQGDLIFADPPYVTAHSQNGFLKYNEKLFSWEDQVRLRDTLLDAKKRGAAVVATNADTPSIRGLYAQHFTVFSTSRSSVIAADAKNRGRTSELIICAGG